MSRRPADQLEAIQVEDAPPVTSRGWRPVGLTLPLATLIALGLLALSIPAALHDDPVPPLGIPHAVSATLVDGTVYELDVWRDRSDRVVPGLSSAYGIWTCEVVRTRSGRVLSGRACEILPGPSSDAAVPMPRHDIDLDVGLFHFCGRKFHTGQAGAAVVTVRAQTENGAVLRATVGGIEHGQPTNHFVLVEPLGDRITWIQGFDNRGQPLSRRHPRWQDPDPPKASCPNEVAHEPGMMRP